MSAPDAHLFQDSLAPGEFVVWTGRPDPKVTFTSGDGCLIPFGGMFGCFSFIWVAGASAANFVFGLFGLPFLAIGIYLAVGRFFYKKWLRERTWYALTNQRAIVLKVCPGIILESEVLAHCPNITKETKTLGTGSIIFSKTLAAPVPGQGSAPPDMGFEIFSGGKNIGPLRFSDIQDVDGVYQKVMFIRLEQNNPH